MLRISRPLLGTLGTMVLTIMAASPWLGCSRVGVYHRVQAGENLYRIGKAYGIHHARLAEINRVAEPERIEVGQRLFIPGARRQLSVDVAMPPAADGMAASRRRSHEAAPAFAWPVVSGTVASEYGQRGRRFHDGIDISAPVGTPVHAAADGEVIYSHVLRGYGKVIIVRHRGGFSTLYAHNHRNLVREGQWVRQGDVIATVGRTGRTTGPNLHFEVRRDDVARNPMYFLPSIEQVAVPLNETGG
jgi:lipoprotein NlpD